MTDDSFTYNGIDVYQLAYLRVVAYDIFTPPLRARKTIIPDRPGAYDFGARVHEERILRMECTIDRDITTKQFDALKRTLGRKGYIVLWDKLDRRFYGRIYDAAQVLDYYDHSMRDFELNFVCDPYATALSATTLETTTNDVALTADTYPGTYETPTRITITNTGTASLSGVEIIVRYRRV